MVVRAEISARTVVGPGAVGSDLAAVHDWWRAANYLAVGQIHLPDDPLLAGPLRPERIEPRLLGHWGTIPGPTSLWAHLNKLLGPATDGTVLSILHLDGYSRHMRDERMRCREHTRRTGEDAPDIRNWTWPGPPPATPASASALGPSAAGR